MLTKKAYGKINLGLDVLGRRPDGYHEVSMIMQTVGIHDILTFEKTEEPMSIVLESEFPGMPLDEKNLVYKAAWLLMEEKEEKQGVRIQIQKQIPMAAGMAGGSSDCAAALLGINELFSYGYTMDELLAKGKTLGADVPYCLLGGTCLSEGIGEILTKLFPAPDCHVLLAKPEEGVSTKEVYEALDSLSSYPHPDIKGMQQCITEGDYKGMTEKLKNVLEFVTVPRHPKIAKIKEMMMENGADGALMSGSGPTVFGLYSDKQKAEDAMEKIRASRLAKDLFLTTFVEMHERR